MRRSQKISTLRSFFALAVLFLLPITIALETSCEAAEPKRVMMLHSFGLRFKPWSEYAETIRSEINRQSQRPVDFLDHSLVNARVNDEQSETPFVDYLSALYVEHPPDLIIAIGAPAATFVQRHRQRLFAKTPMILTAVDQRRVQYEKLTENDTVVPVRNDVPALFENILHVLPLTKTIAIVNGASPIERFWTEQVRRELAPLTSRVELKWYNELPFEDILKDAEGLPPYSAIFLVQMAVDASGVVHETGNALNRLSSSANAPIFSYDDSFFGEALVGGPMFSVLEGGRIAAAVAIRILDGEKAGNIRTPTIQYASPKFDWRQMQRWGVSESNLPPGSSIYFRPPNAWEAYRWPILAACTLVALQGALITLLLFERRRRHSAEMESRQRVVELAHVNRFSTAGELAASIAHEINQPLGAILTNTETGKLILQSETPDLVEMNEILTEIWRDNRRASEVIRRLRSYVTKVPFQRQEFDLNDKVFEAFEFLSAQAKSREIKMRSELTKSPLRVNGDPIQLQQVLANLILNAMDAVSDATLVERSVTVRTVHDRKFAEISIEDTGPGVPPEVVKKIFDPFFSTKENGMGMGLSIVRTIVTAHDGQIQVENLNGAVFRVRLPLIA
jgi:signal transduction histidine kinase